MHVDAIAFYNFRRLKKTVVDLDNEISIFVGANNSGKTSAIHALDLFLSGAKERFSIFDFCAGCWDEFEVAANAATDGVKTALPVIAVDIWLTVDDDNLHRVIDLLPSADWEGTSVGIRIEFGPKDQDATILNYHARRSAASQFIQTKEEHGQDYSPWPNGVRDYLSRELKNEYGFRYYVLDRARYSSDFEKNDGYNPSEILPDADRSGHKIINSLIRLDFLSAQRHLSDGAAQARAEDLSRRLSRFYARNLQQREDDHNALRALALSEEQLSDHLADVFKDIFSSLKKLGIPGHRNPQLHVRAALRLERILGDQQAKVHYVLGPNADGSANFMLPDSYNGLGFKNLIYMGVELLDVHSAWAFSADGEEDKRPPIHLIILEEPEAHMHAQLQQTFIRKVTDLVPIEMEGGYSTQFIVTTHSPHILYERGFKPIRYFRRSHSSGSGQTSIVHNLSVFYDDNAEDRHFLERYLKLTHCDLFFADAAILVEGNVERLVLPLMIERKAERLQSSYLSILEVGGAYAFRFRGLIDFLGLTTLIVTDLDSVHPPKDAASSQNDTNAAVDDDEDDIEDEGDGEDEPKGAGDGPKPQSKCAAHIPGAVTSNQTLKQWLPKKSTVAELWACKPEDCMLDPASDTGAHIYVVYQRPIVAKWNDSEEKLCGRTLEEAFAYENLEWCQGTDQKNLGLRWSTSHKFSLPELRDKIHRRVKGQGFKKTDFALGLLATDSDAWNVPSYISDGLEWLASRLVIEEIEEEQGAAEAVLAEIKTVTKEIAGVEQ